MSAFLMKDSWFKIKLNNDKEVFFIATGDNSLTPIANGNASRFLLGPTHETYKHILRAWAMVGIYPLTITNKPLGPLSTPSWYSKDFDMHANLKCIYFHDLSIDFSDETTEIIWQLELSKPMNPNDVDDLLDHEEDYEEFTEFLTAGIHKYNFRYETPNYSYSPTGLMFCRVGFQWKQYSRRVLIKNTWARDV